MYNNPFASGTSAKMGSSAEYRFDKMAKKARIYLRKATQAEDKSHIDRVINYNGKQIPVEIKAMKKISRSDAAPQDKYTWIELHGVHEFDRGWLFGGKADLIAFETRHGFLFVERKNLISLVNKIVDFKASVSSPQDAVNKIYARRKETSGIFGGGFDKVTLIETNKIASIKFMMWQE